MKELTQIEISKLTDDQLRQELELREKKAVEYENEFFNEINPFSADTEAHHDFELQQLHALQHGIMPHELFEDYDLLVEEAMSRKSFNIYQ